MDYKEFHANLLAYESKWGKLGNGLLAHAGKPWKDHDYLYIDENGNYVYEEKNKNWGRSSNRQNRNKLTKLKGYGDNSNKAVRTEKPVENNKKSSKKEKAANEKPITEEQYNKMQANVVRQYADIARKQSPQAAARAFMKEDAVTELLEELEAGFKNGSVIYTKDGKIKVTDAKTKKNLKQFSTNVSKWANWIGGATGANGVVVQAELKKLINQKIKQYSREKRSMMHSAYNEDYVSYRRKVYQGTLAYNEHHKKTISVDELNRKYEEDLVKNRKVIEVEQRQ